MKCSKEEVKNSVFDHLCTGNEDEERWRMTADKRFLAGCELWTLWHMVSTSGYPDNLILYIVFCDEKLCK